MIPTQSSMLPPRPRTSHSQLVTRHQPPERFTGTVPTSTLAAGTVLSRVHLTRFTADAPNPNPADIRFGGGRFDGTDLDPYPFLYAGANDQAALAETLLRDLDPDDTGARFLAKLYWRGRQLSRLETTNDLELVTLCSGTDLGAIGQDTWLTWCGPDDYPQTRAWAQWLRTEAPNAAGVTWLSKREPAVPSFVFFGDRLPLDPFSHSPGPLDPKDCNFDADDGFTWLQEAMRSYRVAIRR